MAFNAVLNHHSANALDVARLCVGLSDETERAYGELKLCARSRE
jgi:hypothetical protein